MKDVSTRLYLFSVFNSKDADTNELRYLTQIENLVKTKRNVLEIIDNGQKAIALWGDNNFETIVSDLCRIHFQESYKVVYFDDVVELVFNNFRKVIGKKEEVSKEVALASKDYFQVDGRFFVIK